MNENDSFPETLWMAIMQAEQQSLSSSAERTRRYRERKKRGVICVAPVPVYELDTDALVAQGRLKPEDKNDAEKVAEAVEYLIDDWTKGKLAPLGNA